MYGIVAVVTITTRTFLDGTLTVTLILTLRQTLALLRQRLHRKSEAPLKLLHVYYNLTTEQHIAFLTPVRPAQIK